MDEENDGSKDYIRKRKRLSGLFFESALPNEYLVQIGAKKPTAILGGRRFRLFRRFLRIPAFVQTLHFSTDNANMDYQGIGVEGYASWRIDPARPEVAIATLDFFDEDDPMARTSRELKTICIEAVRHVLANMSIDDAMRKKDDIAENLFAQLKEVERKWGILFDQVGIEQVRIMSKSVFENLQASFRAGLRLEAERKRIEVDKEIAGEENGLRERTGMEALETDKKLELARMETASRLKLDGIEKERAAFDLQQCATEERYRRETKFRLEKEESESEVAKKEKTLQAQLMGLDLQILELRSRMAEWERDIGEKQVELGIKRKALEQTWSPSQLERDLIERLPEIMASMKADNYTVLDSAGTGPAARALAECAAVLRQSGLNLGALFPFGKKEGDAERQG